METDHRVLVTGGAGFIGSHVVRALQDAGGDPLVVDNCVSGFPSLLPEGVPLERVDIRDEALNAVVDEFEPQSIVHLAAHHYIPYCNEHPEETFEVNVMGTRNLLDAVRELSNVEAFVFASSAAVYPPAVGPHYESDDPGPTDVYGRTKLIGEDLVRLFHADTSVPTAVARLFNTYGPDETNEHLIPAILRQVKSGSRTIELGNLKPARDFVHVSDVARGILSILDGFDGQFRTYNVGTGTEYSVEDVVEYTSEALGEAIEITQDDDRVRESDRPHLKADVTRMKSDLGWESEVRLVEGLRELLSSDRVLVE